MRPLAGFLFEAACGLAASALILAAVLASYACSSAPVIPSHVAPDDRVVAYCEATRDPLAALPAGVTVPATIAECVTDAECEAAWAEVCAR